MAEVSTITARKGHVQALAFASKGGAALNKLLSSIADQKAAERMGAIQSALFLELHYTSDEQHSIPIVGSKQGETGNDPYDRYTAEIQTEQGKRKVPGSFYTDVVKATDEWLRIQKIIRWLDGNIEEGEIVPDDIKAITKTGAGNAMKQTLRDRISDMRTGLTKGAMLFHHVDEISKINPERIAVKMPYAQRYVLDSNGQRVKIDGTNEYETETVVIGSKIRLFDPSKEIADDKIYSVSSFLQLKPDNEQFQKEAVKTIVNLDETTARAPKAGTTPGTATDVKVPVTVEQLLTQFNALASGMDQESDDGERLYAALLTKASGATDEARETRIAIGKVALALDSLWSVIRPAYMKDIEAQAKANVAKVAASS